MKWEFIFVLVFFIVSCQGCGLSPDFSFADYNNTRVNNATSGTVLVYYCNSSVTHNETVVYVTCLSNGTWEIEGDSQCEKKELCYLGIALMLSAGVLGLSMLCATLVVYVIVWWIKTHFRYKRMIYDEEEEKYIKEKAFV